MNRATNRAHLRANDHTEADRLPRVGKAACGHGMRACRHAQRAEQANEQHALLQDVLACTRNRNAEKRIAALFRTP